MRTVTTDSNGSVMRFRKSVHGEMDDDGSKAYRDGHNDYQVD